MNTFLPYQSFTKSLQCLDYKRLGKQRVEAKQILNVLDPNYDKKGWRNHPAVLMWEGFEEALKLYQNIAIDIWIARGYKNTMPFLPVTLEKVEMPHWFGNKDFHNSHKSNLLRKNPEFYSKYEWFVPPTLEYYWPTKVSHN